MGNHAMVMSKQYMRGLHETKNSTFPTGAFLASAYFWKKSCEKSKRFLVVYIFFQWCLCPERILMAKSWEDVFRAVRDGLSKLLYHTNKRPVLRSKSAAVKPDVFPGLTSCWWTPVVVPVGKLYWLRHVRLTDVCKNVKPWTTVETSQMICPMYRD